MILVVPKKALTQAEKKELLKKGYVVIECEKPESVRVLSPETIVDKSDLFLSALEAIRPTTPLNGAERFVDNLCKRLLPEKKETTAKKSIIKTKASKPTILKEPIPKF